MNQFTNFNNGNKKAFSGYRSYPVYMERVNAFMLNCLANKEEETGEVSNECMITPTYSNGQDNKNINGYSSNESSFSSYATDPYEQQQGTNRISKLRASRQQASSTNSNVSRTASRPTASRKPIEETQETRTGSRSVASSGNEESRGTQRRRLADRIQNDRESVDVNTNRRRGGYDNMNTSMNNNNMNHTINPLSNKKNGPNYRVNLAITSGAFQSDSF